MQTIKELEKELKTYDVIIPVDNYEKGLKDANRTRCKELIQQKKATLELINKLYKFVEDKLNYLIEYEGLNIETDEGSEISSAFNSICDEIEELKQQIEGK